MFRKSFLILVLSATIIYAFCLVGHAEKLILLHTNDIHGLYQPTKVKVESKEKLVGGMEALAHYIAKVEAEEENVLVINTGDLFKGTLLSEIPYRGVVGGGLIEFLNVIGYDIWQYGNHAFDYGQSNCLGAASIAEFPTAMANIVYKDTGRSFPVQPYAILEVGSLKVGFAVEDVRDMGLPLDVVQMEWLEIFKVLNYEIEGRIIELE